MMARGILGKKLGMTQIFEADGTLVPVTVVEAGPCVVLANKTEETDGYNAIGVSRGKGFAGTIERHNFARGPMKHGSKSHREPGSNGPMHSGPGGRVIKGKKLPGRLGGQSATVQRLTIAKVDAERNLIMVKGSVPGAAGTFLMLRDTVRPVVKKADKK